MDDFLTTRQVQDFLKVDRITVYRMLQDGRIKGSKIGQQWRFNRREVERLVNGNPVPEEAIPQAVDPTFPSHCVQTIQDLFTGISNLSAFVVDNQGELLTNTNHFCEMCPLLLETASGRSACQASWKSFAEQAAVGSRYFTCHAGLQYIAAPIIDYEQQSGVFLIGEFYWQSPDAREEAERLRRLSNIHAIPLEKLQQAARTIPVIEPQRHAMAETWPATAARAIQSILHERSGYVQRLQQIANLTKVS
jgi:excisionase family DNA binding protein